MNITKILALAVIIFTSAIVWAYDSVHGKVTVTVLDDSGSPVSGAKIRIGFKHLKDKLPGQGWGVDVDYHPKEGLSDGSGMFSAADNTYPEIVVTVNKDDYYEGYDGVTFNDHNRDYQSKVILKKKRNPGAMYAQRVEWIKIPAYDTPVGYDLEVGDWAAPYGKGKISDFVFKFTIKPHEISYVLTFSNPQDGIQEFQFDPEDHSSYRWPFEAPESDYLPTLMKNLKYVDGKMQTDLKSNGKINYIFRVRSIEGDKGQLAKACYGKIIGEIDVATKGLVSFLYFFNPDGTRNLEFDYRKNLFLPPSINKNKRIYNKYRVNDISL